MDLGQAISEALQSSGLGEIKDSKGESFSDFMKRMEGSGIGQRTSPFTSPNTNIKGGPAQGQIKDSIKDLLDTIDKGAISLLRADGIPALFERMTKDSRTVLFGEVKKAADAQQPGKIDKIMANISIVEQIAELAKKLTVIK